MADQLAVWQTEHANFVQLLDLMEAQVRTFQTGERPNYELMIDVVRYLRHYSDRFHHRLEDVAFSRLVERDAGMQLVVNRLLQEHRVIAAAGDELLKRLNEITDDIMTARATVEAAAATYLLYYRHHIATEDNEIMPRVAQTLTQDDWTTVTAAVPADADTLFGHDFESRYRELRRQIALDACVSREGGRDLADYADN